MSNTKATAGVIRNDPATYRKMCEPLESNEAANEALEGFHAAVMAARIQFRIKDVHFIAEVQIDTPAGEIIAMTSGHLGNPDRAESMVAWELGRVQSDRQAMIGSLLSKALTDQAKGKK